MHILFLTDNFPPEVNAPASRTFEHCREWVKAGHRVSVVTCAPNFPTGRLLSGYTNRLVQREVIDGIEVTRVWSYITANEGFLRRTLDYLSFMGASIVVAPWIRDPTVVVATSPQFFTAVAGWIVSAVRRKPFVLEIRDLWPESIRAVGAMNNSRLLRMLEAVELFLYRRASVIVTVTHAAKVKIANREIWPGKIAVVTNGADLSRFKPARKDPSLLSKFGLSDAFVAGYIGTHGLAHGLETVLRAADLMRARPDGADVHFLFIGDGAEKGELKRKSQELGLENVHFIDTVPKDEVTRYWALLDVCIIHLRKERLFESVIPSKLFEAMAMGVPVLHGVEGESAEIVEKERVGVTFAPENHQDLVEKLLALKRDSIARDEYARRGPIAARSFDRAHLARAMLGTLEHAAS